MTTSVKEVEITGREAYLILEYGYPFGDEENQLQKISQVKGWHKFQADEFYIEHIIADLCRSMREVKGEQLIEEIDHLCNTLESSLNPNLVWVR